VDGQWRLYGTKWFSSATASQMALTLARPEGNPDGGRGLALFYLETRNADGTMNNILVNRLKDKLGTRKVPTAELTLDGAIAVPVVGLTDGVRNIAPMLNVTRTWNSVCASSGARRAIALARDYAQRRVAFGAPLARKPLHLDTLAGLQAEAEAAFHLTFRGVELLGRDESGEASEAEKELLRLLTPVMKLTTGRQAVSIASETLEAFGGAGYVEDTGLPQLLRDAQVLSIWEGTTNVLSLDVLRALGRSSALDAYTAEVEALCAAARHSSLVPLASKAREACAHARGWLMETYGSQPEALEGNARRFALTLGRTLALALMIRHAQWSIDHEHDARSAAAASRFARHGVNLLEWTTDTTTQSELAALANDTPLPA
jgi:hypothetical protein